MTDNPILARINGFSDELTAIRRDIHAHPEIGFEEVRTSALVAKELESYGVEVHRGLGKTGVVGILKGKTDSNRRIGLRADMDALPIEETTNLPWRSTKPGTMHACGHDGHTTMLLGAARYLAETRNFSGSVAFIFQPAEEGLGGARAMIADGLFKQFPCNELYGMHNSPIGPQGSVAFQEGPAMAGADFFDIRIEGKGSHGAHPEFSRDPVIIAMTLGQAMQTIVSRNIDPTKTGVVSITKINAGSAYNVIPETAHLAGTVRCFDDSVRTLIRERIHALCAGIGAAFGATITADIRDVFSVLSNAPEQTKAMTDVARKLFGAQNVQTDVGPKMGSEDFADMLMSAPGCYAWIGMTPGPSVHNPAYVFDDTILPIGAALYAGIVEERLKAA